MVLNINYGKWEGVLPKWEDTGGTETSSENTIMKESSEKKRGGKEMSVRVLFDGSIKRTR